MVNITAHRPHLLHISSAHRQATDSISDYRILTNINCAEGEKMQAQLVSARIPASTWYLSDEADRKVTVSVNVDSTTVGDTTYKTTVEAGILAGSYTQASLISALITAINAKFTTTYTTNLRPIIAGTGGNAPNDAEWNDDVTDVTTSDDFETSDFDFTANNGAGTASFDAQPVFSITTSSLRNLCQITRIDAGGKVVLGAFSITITGKRLAAALGLETGTHHSYHARNLSGVTTTTFLGDTYVNSYKLVGATNAVSSTKVSNMHYDDDLYIHCGIGNDSITTTPNKLGQAMISNVIAVVPQYGNAFEDSFYEPPVPNAMTTDTSNLTEFRFRLCNSAGVPVDFHGVDHTLELQISVMDKDFHEQDNANLHSMGKSNSDYHRMHGPSRFATTLY